MQRDRGDGVVEGSFTIEDPVSFVGVDDFSGRLRSDSLAKPFSYSRSVVRPPFALPAQTFWRRSSGGRCMSRPSLAIVTPVYNGACHLGECIESVLAQTYENWVLVVVDNASCDSTREIANAFAARDKRIQVVEYDTHVGMLKNWNRAMSHVPADVRYVKQLNADDCIAPNCLEKMVAAAEAHPEAGVVSSYFRFGSRRLPDCELDAIQVVGGSEVVRSAFLGGPDFLAAPSVLLFRRESMSTWPELFEPAGFPPGFPGDPPLCQADKEGVFPAMETADLVFVPEELTTIRSEDDSATGFSARVAAWQPGWIELLLRHGDQFLTRDEYGTAMRRATRKYVRSLLYRCLKGAPFRDAEFLRFQRLALAYLLPRLREDRNGNLATWLEPFAFMLGAKRAEEQVSCRQGELFGD